MLYSLALAQCTLCTHTPKLSELSERNMEATMECKKFSGNQLLIANLNSSVNKFHIRGFNQRVRNGVKKLPEITISAFVRSSIIVK